MKTMKTKSALLMSVLSLVLCVAMLTSTTFAWFTDTAVSANNTIISGNLDVVLEYKNDWSESWKTVDETTKIFDENALYEPGYTEVVYLRVSNAGSLALRYNLMLNISNEKASINVKGDSFKLSEHLQIGTYCQDEYGSGFNYADILMPTMFGTREAALSNVGTLTKLSEANTLVKSNAPVLAGDKTAQVMAIVLTMPETVGNEANYDSSEANAPTLELGFTLVATQLVSENDSFGNEYDKNADYDGEVSTLTALVAAIEKGGAYKMVKPITLEEALVVSKDFLLDLDENTLEGGVIVEAGATLTIGNGTISNADSANSGIQSNAANLTINNADITSARHAVRIEGGTATINGGIYKTAVSPNRATAMTQHALNVSDGATVTIIDGTFVGPKGTGADSGSAVNVQANSTVYIYGGYFSGGLNKTLSAKGTLTIYGGKFDQDPSAYVADGYVANKNADGTWTVEKRTADTWDGTADTSWYNDTDTTFTLTTAEQLAGFAKLVDDGKTFEGKTVALGTDINLANILFNPIGSYRFDTSFKGTFDGQGHTISNLSQNTWGLDNGYYYNDCGLGLFGAVEGGTVKNLVIDGAEVSGESAICGTIAAAAHNATFENITVKNANVNDYLYYAGGVVGWASGNQTYKNINIDASTTIGGQWGDFGNANGGLIGGISSSAVILIKDCTIACRIDAVNDVVSAYQWYNYRNSGMIVGRVPQTTTNGEVQTVKTPENITCENVTVIYGDWANYHYCEFAGTGYPYVRVEAGVSVDAYSNVRYGHPTDANGNTVVDDNHVHNDGEDHHELIAFDQLFGGPADQRYCYYGISEFTGVTVEYNNK